MLRCPTCLSLLFDEDAKRCPSCRSKLRKRSRPDASAEHRAIAERPLPLVERELQARIEAETASGFRQRRRAAKVARRIAALPPTVFDGDAIPSPAEPEPATPPPTEASSTIIDLPAEAVHEVTSKASVIEVPAEPVVETEPAVVDPPAAPKRKTRRRAPRSARIEGVLASVEADVEPEPVVEPAPLPAANWERTNSVWTDRVFNTAPRDRDFEAVSWPPRRATPAE